MSVRNDSQSLPVGCSGAMRIGSRVCDARVCETLPSKVLRRAPRPRWPHTIKRGERWSAASKMALGIPSKEILIIGEALYPCSLARSAPSSATDLAYDSSSASKSVRACSARREGAGESQARCDGFPNREHDSVHRSVDQVRRGSHGLSRSVRPVEAEEYGTTLASSRHDTSPLSLCEVSDASEAILSSNRPTFRVIDASGMSASVIGQRRARRACAPCWCDPEARSRARRRRGLMSDRMDHSSFVASSAQPSRPSRARPAQRRASFSSRDYLLATATSPPPRPLRLQCGRASSLVPRVAAAISFSIDLANGTGRAACWRGRVTDESHLSGQSGRLSGSLTIGDRTRELSDNRLWTSTTSGAKVVRAPAPVGWAVAIGPDGEELRSWT
jgi:hypothetical protein